MDRNATAAEIIRRVAASLSARRAWIEIRITPTPSRLMRSLSARRAWIEIARRWQMTQTKTVALRKESVDRNLRGAPTPHGTARRSPQGERG